MQYLVNTTLQTLNYQIDGSGLGLLRLVITHQATKEESSFELVNVPLLNEIDLTDFYTGLYKFQLYNAAGKGDELIDAGEFMVTNNPDVLKSFDRVNTIKQI